MVNPRWRPTIANSRKTTKSKQKDDRVDGFDLPVATTSQDNYFILFQILCDLQSIENRSSQNKER